MSKPSAVEGEQVDHRAVAERRIDRVSDLGPEDPRVPGEIGLAQVHADLAIAEQLERLNETLEQGAIEVMYGGRMV